MAARDVAPRRFVEFGHGQAQIGQRDMAAPAHDHEHQAADRFADAAQDGQRQEMQQPQYSEQDPHAAASLSGPATPSGCL